MLGVTKRKIIEWASQQKLHLFKYVHQETVEWGDLDCSSKDPEDWQPGVPYPEEGVFDLSPEPTSGIFAIYTRDLSAFLNPSTNSIAVHYLHSPNGLYSSRRIVDTKGYIVNLDDLLVKSDDLWKLKSDLS